MLCHPPSRRYDIAQRSGYFAAIVCMLLASSACSKKADPRDAVRAVIKACEDHANAGRPGQIGSYVDDDYEDVQGRNKNVVMRLVERHTKRHSKRFVHARPLKITVEDDKAQAAVIVALAGQRIGPKDDLLKVSADLMKLQIDLRRGDDGWLVTAAQWKRPSPLDVL